MSQTEPYGISALSEQGKPEAFAQTDLGNFRNTGATGYIRSFLKR